MKTVQHEDILSKGSRHRNGDEGRSTLRQESIPSHLMMYVSTVVVGIIILHEFGRGHSQPHTAAPEPHTAVPEPQTADNEPHYAPR